MSDRPWFPVLSVDDSVDDVGGSCYTLRVDLTPEEVDALGFILRYVEIAWNVDETLPDGVVRKALLDARHLYSQCMIAMNERLEK